MTTPDNQNSAAFGASEFSALLERIPMEWKPDTGMWSSGEVLWCGKWPVGKAAHTIVTNGDPNCYAAYLRLPGLKEMIGRHASIDKAKEHAERAARHWLAGLRSNE